MKLLYWLLARWSPRARALWLYKRGLAHASRHDRKAALADYSAVIDLPEAPSDVRAMALYNRAIIHAADHDNAQAVVDLELLLELPGASSNVRLEARRKLVRMQKATDRTEPEQAQHSYHRRSKGSG